MLRDYWQVKEDILKVNPELQEFNEWYRKLRSQPDFESQEKGRRLRENYPGLRELDRIVDGVHKNQRLGNPEWDYYLSMFHGYQILPENAKWRPKEGNLGHLAFFGIEIK